SRRRGPARRDSRSDERRRADDASGLGAAAPPRTVRGLPAHAASGCRVARAASHQPAEQPADRDGRHEVNKPSILVVGGGGHARVFVDVIEQEGRYAIAGVVIAPFETATTVLGYKTIGTDDDLPALVAAHRHAIVTVGQIKSPDTRIRLFERLVML